MIGLLALAGCALPPLPGGTRPLVKIGLAAPFEGLDRPLGYDALQGVKSALAERNTAGGVGGAMVELVALNDSGEAGEARLQASEFAADPAVMGVVTGWSEETARAALPVYRQKGLGVVVPWSAPAELADHQAGVVLAAADVQRAAEALVGAIAAAGPPRRLVVVGQEPDAAQYVTALSERGLAAQTVLPPGDAPQAWAARLTQSRMPPPDVLLLTSDGALTGEALAALSRLGWSGAVYGGVNAGDIQLVNVAGAAADGTMLVSPAPAGRDAPGGHADLGPRAVLAYDATQVLLDAMEIAGRRDGQITRQGVITALATVRRRGLTGDIAFDAGGRRVDAPLWLYQIVAAAYPGDLKIQR
jgi:branched-chain amino acid transport system substrate-binding protein